MKKNIDDKERCGIVLSSEPINITAARVMWKGEDYNVNLNDRTKLCQEECPPLRMLSKEHKKNPETIDFTGFKKGSITVIGVYAGNKKIKINEQYKFINTGKHRWVVKCICGKYELRSSKSLKGNNNGEKDTCYSCNIQNRGVKHRDFYRQNGYWPEEEILKFPHKVID